MHLFLARQVPMADALRFTADGLALVRFGCREPRACATDVEAGMGLTESMAKYREFPASIQPVV